jgi:hypothetical protein
MAREHGKNSTVKRFKRGFQELGDEGILGFTRIPILALEVCFVFSKTVG